MYIGAVSKNQAEEVTRILADDRLGAGDRAERLLPLVYEQLRAIAERRMRDERPGHTLEATALVHEAYLRLIGNQEWTWDSRGHFYVAAAEAMQRILIEHARARGRLRRGGPGPRRIPLTISAVADLGECEDPYEIVAFDGAFRSLQEQAPRVAEVVRLRFYAGLSVEQTATAL